MLDLYKVYCTFCILLKTYFAMKWEGSPFYYPVNIFMMVALILIHMI